MNLFVLIGQACTKSYKVDCCETSNAKCPDKFDECLRKCGYDPKNLKPKTRVCIAGNGCNVTHNGNSCCGHCGGTRNSLNALNQRDGRIHGPRPKNMREPAPNMGLNTSTKPLVLLLIAIFVCLIFEKYTYI